jgi:hypothetical protein
MPSTPRPWLDALWIWSLATVSLLKIWIDRRSPDSLASEILSYAMAACFLTLFGRRIWAGYRRRQPYWTRESWRRYARLAAMPIALLIVLFTELYLFDAGVGRSVFGASGSALRWLWIVFDIALMLLGAIGLATAVSWLSAGEPTEQFTRTRWFQNN